MARRGLDAVTADVELTAVGLAAFAASLELAAVAAYQLGLPKLRGPALTMAKLFASHHQQHAAAFNALTGTRAVTRPNPRLVAALEPQFTDALDQTGVLALVYGVENKAAATYQYAIETLASAAAAAAATASKLETSTSSRTRISAAALAGTSISTRRLAASVLPVECEHAVVLGLLLGKPAQDVIPLSFQGKDEFFDPVLFPTSG